MHAIDEQTMPSTAQLSHTIDSLATKIDYLINAAKALDDKIAVSNLRRSSSLDFQSIRSCVYESVASALLDADLLEDKSSRAVIIGLKEASTPENTRVNDEKSIAALCEWSNDEVVKRSFHDGEVTVYRHTDAYGNHGSRPTKIQFRSREIRDRFLSGIRARGGRPAPLVGSPGSYVRRDLTHAELCIERERKAEVKEMNLRAGHVLFGMRDTSIITYRNPRAFPVNYVSHLPPVDPISMQTSQTPQDYTTRRGPFPTVLDGDNDTDC